MTAITAEDLIRRLERFQACGPIPLDVKRGEIMGILCSGDRSRETLAAIISTVLFPVPAFAERSPLAILGNLGDVRRSMGIVFPEPVLDPALTVRENLNFHAQLQGMSNEVRRRRILDLARLFGLSDSLDVAVGTCSPTMVRHLEIARAFLAYPGVLFLAEPTKGLDDSGREETWKLLQRLNRERGVTVIFTTQDLVEAEAICTRVAVIDGGEIVALDTPETFRAIMTVSSASMKFDDIV
ncbi:ATP-binding cassette domain-containing protein [Methanoculleus thermophilus]|jgi:ABC-2 type transport system ATP-binding protein|uniref:ABC-2 type transport system ATP-binding protein n=1 Tax=Methanoculleus thermophilus TaxID=2200 RepID=A0A1G8X4X5_9EURY|nr:ATP-binding cassette domain-containing protein [Methanoculleus thermophilus]SDJ85376.1 ABC-2 type transport system ATP-binding protein [Methanoculleus thermophilus]HQD26601.1 ATP-binding cassette domain-containing protein [Methanoculleus thermophilus]